MRPPFHLAIVLLALAVPAAAQLTEKEAVADVKAAGKAQLTAFKAVGQSALVQLDAELALLQSAFSESTTPEALAASVANAAIDYVTTLNGALDDALSGVDASVFIALTELDGAQPDGLLLGTGGTLDIVRASFARAAAKMEAAARKRLAKMVSFAEKHLGKGLTVVLRFPATPPDSAPHTDGLGGIAIGPALDVLTACSALDVEGDACLVVAGFTENTFQDPDVELGIAGVESDDSSIVPEPGTGRFAGIFGGEGAGLPEGNYSAWAKQGDGPFAVGAAIGAR